MVKTGSRPRRCGRGSNHPTCLLSRASLQVQVTVDKAPQPKFSVTGDFDALHLDDARLFGSELSPQPLDFDQRVVLVGGGRPLVLIAGAALGPGDADAQRSKLWTERPGPELDQSQPLSFGHFRDLAAKLSPAVVNIQVSSQTSGISLCLKRMARLGSIPAAR